MQTWVLLSKWEHRSLPSMSIWDIPAFRRSNVVFLMYSMSKPSSVECRTINKLSNRLVVVNWKRRSEWQNLLYIEVSISNLWAGDDFGYFVICRGLPQSILFFVLIFFLPVEVAQQRDFITFDLCVFDYGILRIWLTLANVDAENTKKIHASINTEGIKRIISENKNDQKNYGKGIIMLKRQIESSFREKVGSPKTV